jgi:chromosome segregation ATPase
MKKLLFLAAGMLALTACQQKGGEADQRIAVLQDSLNRIIEQKDNEINDMVGTLNEIEEGFRSISEAENRVTLAKSGEGATSQERIRENMQFIAQTMRQNRELINKLKNQLRQSSVKGDELRRTIENLTRQMEEKDAKMKEMLAELEAKNVQIGELNTQVAELSSDVAALKEESSQKTETITTQDKQLNTAWFVYGTKKELKEQHIIEDGKVLQANFNRDYFTKIDIRVDKEIRLYSRSAKLLTVHPESSYTLQRDANKQYILRITNPQLFWATSKYLVVQVK